MTRNGLIAVLVGAAAAGLWLVLTLGPERDRPSAAPEPPGSYSVEARGGAAAEPEPEPAPELDQDPAPAQEPAAANEAPAPERPDPAYAPLRKLPAPEKTGPVDELKARFEGEPRESSARAIEKQIEAAFDGTDVPAGLLESVVCHTSVCRVRARWTPERAIGFMAAFTRLLLVPPGSTTPQPFDSNLGILPLDDAPQGDEHRLEVYVKRNPPPEPAR